MCQPEIRLGSQAISRSAPVSIGPLHTSSNHRLESAGLNALEELLFKVLGMGIEDSTARLVI